MYLRSMSLGKLWLFRINYESFMGNGSMETFPQMPNGYISENI